ncbi:MAG: VanZ family protein [Chlorobi bacterium]|nr:VanZ family protein [Chlorobiota bacterium]
MKKVRDLLKHNLFAILWMVFLAFVMLLPLPTPTQQMENYLLDKLIHAISYGILTFFWAYGLFRQRDFILLRNYALPVAATISFLYSILLEVGQSVVPYRSFEIWDVLANLLGIIFAYLIMRRLIAEAKQKTQKALL